MNWEAIGAVGSILGAIAVVVTLLYLARQTSENSRALKASAAREITLAEAQMHSEIANSPRLTNILAKSFNPTMPDYTDKEWIEFRMLAMRLFLQFEIRHTDRDLQIDIQDQNTSRLSVAKGLIDAFPAWHRFWSSEVSNGGFTPGFVAAVNSASTEAQMAHIAEGNVSDT